jgi:hypothetical protein
VDPRIEVVDPLIKVIYLAHPIRDNRGIWYHNVNIRQAEAIALELWQMGFAVICPGKNTENFDGAAPDAVWLQGDLEMLARCDAVVMAPGWSDSRGAKDEYALASELEKPVFFWQRSDHRNALQRIGLNQAVEDAIGGPDFSL